MPRLLKDSLLIAIAFFLINTSAKAQDVKADIGKLLSYEVQKPEFAPVKTRFMFTGSKNVIVRYNPVSLMFGSMMYIYQGYFSKQFSSSCLYNPSCSNMSKLLIHDFGIVKGVFLSADRLTRCNRLAAAQVHPMRINPSDGKVHETSDVYRFKHDKRHTHVH